MGSFTINSFHYYNGTTPGAPQDSETLTKGPLGVGNLTSSYAEIGGSVDDVARPGETLDPDYSSLGATFYGLYNDGVRTFLVLEDEFGFFLATSEVGLTASDFPDTFVYSAVDDSPTATTPACFLSGTHITTPTGSMAVEDLSVGDLILTADGKTVPVKWVGRQKVLTLFDPAERLLPVRVKSGALGDGLPLRDLTLTTDHALMVDDLLINAGALVNRGNIDLVALSEFGGTYTVYHVETENHDVILAEGAPAETFIDYLGRQTFDNYSEYTALYGDDRTIPEMPYIRISAARLVPPEIKERLGIDQPLTIVA